ncbi:enoyl-CoA hydratase/isomerase family protein [Mycolicibacterium sp. 22603]|uniref:enoyl-CoA hydratase/isomerase family protein n=1 Tax=Mycolicibacterium sp. 22603 TaxID=3453950 RepID=UPI003F85133F
MTKPEDVPPTGLTLDDHDGVLVVTLNRPPANALNRAVIGELTDLFAGLTASADAPAVVLTGHGDRFFSAGGDIKELEGVAADQIDGRMRAFHSLLMVLDRYPRPVIGAINGYCVGGGMEIALFTDTVLAVEHAQFGFPEIKHGLLPADKGIQRAIRILGARATRAMLLSGELFGVQHAAALGLVDRIVDRAQLLPSAVAVAEEASVKAPVLYHALKRSVNSPDDAADENSLHRTLHDAAAYFDDPVARALRGGWSVQRTRERPHAATRQPHIRRPAEESH